MLLMVQDALNQITNQFINLKIIEKEKAQLILNDILKELKINSNFDFKDLNSKTDLNNHFKNINCIRNYLKENTNLSDQEIENKINYLLSLYLPSQDELNKILDSKNDPINFLKTISLFSYYVKKDKNDQNLIWNHKTRYGNLKISINKAKPEKTIEEIKKAKTIKNQLSHKPKCVICVENIGYRADSFSDSRENLRVKFLDLSNGKWFLQFSPYAYVNNHFVVNNFIHTPMKITNNSIRNLIIFVKNYPKYFLGSNADLEIIGGSLLAHDHYQGGEDTLPIMNAKILKKISLLNIDVEILKWPLNTLRLVTKDENKLYNLASYFITNWKHLDDKNIIKNQKNNSTTLILNKIKNKYHLYIIFRNNIVTKKRPFGLFHFHHNKFNIKQENIGLMEAAGLAILPQRLENELIACAKLVESKNLAQIKNDEKLSKHFNWIKKLLKENNKIDTKNIFNYASNVFTKGLEDCKVLDNQKFIKYIESLILYDEIKIKNNKNLKVVIHKRGFTIKELSVNQKQYLLRFQNKLDYYSNSIFLNSFVGPIAGRIEKGIIVNPFNKQKIILPVDSNQNYIHSMDYNFANVNFNFREIKKNNKTQSIIGYKRIFNDDLNINYYVQIKLRIWNNENRIKLDYQIKADNDFIANSTQHFYFSFQNKNSQTKIDRYQININNEDLVWNLNQNLNPLSTAKINLENNFNTIKEVAEQLGKNQHKIVNGLIDHPFISKKNKIILKDRNSQINLKSKIKDFVIYTQNYPSQEKLLNLDKSSINCAVCIEFQNNPTSLKNLNYKKIYFKSDQKYTNSIEIKIER